MTDGFEMLVEDHRAVARLFETYLHDNEDSVAHEICAQLTVHTQVEEAALYPALRRYVDGGDDLADEAEQEHSAVKTLVARVYDSPPDQLLDLVSALRREVEHHVEPRGVRAVSPDARRRRRRRPARRRDRRHPAGRRRCVRLIPSAGTPLCFIRA